MVSESKLLVGAMPVYNNSLNFDSYGCRKRAWFLFKNDKGTVKKTVKQNKRRVLFAYKNTFMKRCGGFAANNYWSSSENNANNAWKQNFNNGNQNNDNKNNTNYVRAVRDFKQNLIKLG